MSRFRKLIVAAGLLCSAFLMVVVLTRNQHGQMVPMPLPEPSSPNLPWAGLSDSERDHFLDGDFNILVDVRKLPLPVLREFTDPSSTRLVIANPHGKWEFGDLISDATLPRQRLILAGVAGEKCFVHYERGGRGVSYIVDLFGSTPDHEMKFLWRGFCRAPATNITDLRQCVVSAM